MFSDLEVYVVEYINTKNEKRQLVMQGKVTLIHKHGKMVTQNRLLRIVTKLNQQESILSRYQGLLPSQRGSFSIFSYPAHGPALRIFCSLFLQSYTHSKEKKQQINPPKCEGHCPFLCRTNLHHPNSRSFSDDYTAPENSRAKKTAAHFHTDFQ